MPKFEVADHYGACALSSMAFLISTFAKLHGYFYPMKPAFSAAGILNASITKPLVGTAEIFIYL